MNKNVNISTSARKNLMGMSTLSDIYMSMNTNVNINKNMNEIHELHEVLYMKINYFMLIMNMERDTNTTWEQTWTDTDMNMDKDTDITNYTEKPKF
jgi:DNA-binding transcriptional regulator YiaG